MLSKKLIVSLGVDLQHEKSVGRLAKQQRKRKVQIHDSHIRLQKKCQHDVCDSDNDELSVDSCSSHISTSTHSYASSCTHSLLENDGSDEEEYEKDDMSAWTEEYQAAKHNQTESQITGIEREMADIQTRKYGTCLLDKLRMKDDGSRLEELQLQLKSLQSVNKDTDNGAMHIDYDECHHCGIVGMVHINVHRCVAHCMACHREMAVEHFFETTGTNLMTTNPGRYTRRGHFQATLKRIQAMRPVKFPPTLLGEVKRYFQTHFHAEKPKDINYKYVKDVLKALGYNNKRKKGDFTEHIMAVYCQLTGRTPPRFTIGQHQTLVKDFDELDGVFEQACIDVGEDRNNWLSYEFTIYRLCLKNHYDNMTEWLGILKGQVTLRCQDKIMQRMFELCGWPFEPLRFEEMEKSDKYPREETPLKSRKQSHQLMITDMMAFMDHHKQILTKSSRPEAETDNPEDHIMSTDESDTEPSKKKKKRMIKKRKAKRKDRRKVKRRHKHVR